MVLVAVGSGATAVSPVFSPKVVKFTAGRFDFCNRLFVFHSFKMSCARLNSVFPGEATQPLGKNLHHGRTANTHAGRNRFDLVPKVFDHKGVNQTYAFLIVL